MPKSISSINTVETESIQIEETGRPLSPTEPVGLPPSHLIVELFRNWESFDSLMKRARSVSNHLVKSDQFVVKISQ